MCTLRTAREAWAALMGRLRSLTLVACDLAPRGHLLEAPHQVLADALAQDGVAAGLARYEAERRPRTSQIVLSNRKHGPERVMDLAEQRAPSGFTDVNEVFAPGELEEVAAQYRQLAGFDLDSILNPARQRRA